MRARLAHFILVSGVVLLGGCGTSHAQASNNPLANVSFYVDPASAAATQAGQSRAAGRTAEATAIERIALQPTATWLTNGPDVRTEAEALTTRAAATGRSALLVAYYIPGRDCGGFSAGGAPTPAAYRQWIANLALGIGERQATVILEPDAVLQAVSGCLNKTAATQRFALLAAATRALRALPHVTVYLDAGNAGWLKRPRTVARALRLAGIAAANGFALNVANFYTTSATVTAGERLSTLLAGSHFVVDTSRNGNGPATQPDGGPLWCDPPGRALGTAPTTRTGVPRVDAFLWIKQPGVSDGACRAGAPAAGVWWPAYALELATGI